MKRRDEIDEIEDIELDDEIIDDDVLDDEIIDDDEIEEEVPSKKSKKAKQPKKKGKSKKGLIIGIVAGVLVVALAGGVLGVGFGILGWGKDLTVKDASAAFTATFGNEAPDLDANTPIYSNMTVGEMCLAAVDNYYNANYVACICKNGGVITTITGLGNVTQAVQSISVRIGVGDAEENDNSTNTKYFATSKSFGISEMCEEYYSTGDNVTYRKGSGIKTTGTDPVVSAASNFTASDEYDSIQDFINETATNFTKIWAYKVDKTTILNYDDPVDEKDGVYLFTVKLDKQLATADYLGIMQHQLEDNMGFKLGGLDFTTLELEFAVYANGFIKYIYVHEAYDMKISEGLPLGIKLNMNIANNCMNEYCFDSSKAVPYAKASGNNVTEVDFDFDTICVF